MKTMKLVVIKRDYVVFITHKEMLRLIKQEGGDTLDRRLDSLDGVENTEYDGFYGPKIFFRVRAEYDTPKLHEQILSLIREYTA